MNCEEQDRKRQHKPRNVGGRTQSNLIPLTDYYERQHQNEKNLIF
jgi:hypothetical protein